MDFIVYLICLFNEGIAEELLGELLYFSTMILPSFYLAMIHVQNFKVSAEDYNTTVYETESEDEDELNDSFEENFANLFLLGKVQPRIRLNTTAELLD